MDNKNYVIIDGIKYDENRIKQLQQIEDNSKLVIDSIESILEQLIINGEDLEQTDMNIIWGCWKLLDGYQKEFLSKK